jgi:hypothetical protein
MGTKSAVILAKHLQNLHDSACSAGRPVSPQPVARLSKGVEDGAHG